MENKRIFIVDMENTNDMSFIKGHNLTPKDKVILFLSEKSKSLKPYDLHYMILNNINYRSEYVQVGTPNAMDFQIVVRLTLLIKNDPEKDYYIVSNDNGYTAAVSYLKEEFNCNITLLNTDTTINSTSNSNSNVIAINKDTNDLNKKEIIKKIIESKFKVKNLDQVLSQIDFLKKSDLHNGLVKTYGAVGRNMYEMVKGI